MKKIKNIVLIVLVFLFVLFSCDGTDSNTDASNSDTNGDSNSSNLTSLLTTPGNKVDLPVSGGSSLQGMVIDENDDGVGDGLDLDGTGSSNIAYLSGSLASAKVSLSKNLKSNLATKSTLSDSIASFIVGDPDKTSYSFQVGEETTEVFISLDVGGVQKKVTVVLDTETGILLGMDTDSDGLVDVDVLKGIIPAFISGERTAEPVFSVASGTYDSAQSISLSSTTEGAVIFFTTNGKIPTIEDSIYSEITPIVVGSTKTIYAIAYKEGQLISKLVTASYTITVDQVAAPVFSPPGGMFEILPNEVFISSSTSGAEIYFTMTGDTPTILSNLYDGSVALEGSVIIKAIAVKAGMIDSEVVTEAYTEMIQ